MSCAGAFAFPREFAAFAIGAASLFAASMWVESTRRVPLVAPAAASEIAAPASRAAQENPDVGEAQAFPDDVADYSQLG